MPKITVSSTGWYHIDVDAVANYDDEIKIGKRKYSRKSTCYVKPISLVLTGESWRKLVDLVNHMEGDCDPKKCKLCKALED
jgi:hypothetical protein